MLQIQYNRHYISCVMSLVELKPGLPVGEGGKLNRFAAQNWQEHRIQLTPVDNKVIWVNPNFPNLPFNLEVGKPTPLALFAKNSFNEEPVSELKNGNQIGEYWAAHSRSALLARAMIADNKGQVFRDIDLKGMGLVAHEFFITGDDSNNVKSRAKVDPEHLGYWEKGLGSNNYFGLQDVRNAKYNAIKSEKFNDLGISSSRTLAIIMLKEVVKGDAILSVSKFKKDMNLSNGFTPVVEVRAFANKFRIRDCYMNEQWPILLDDAKTIISRGFGLSAKMSNDEYLEWLAKVLGRNMGLMHRNGWAHGYLNAHNIGLDGSIVDLDSVHRLTESSSQERDRLFVLNALEELYGSLQSSMSVELFCGTLTNEYEKIFPPDDQVDYFISLKTGVTR